MLYLLLSLALTTILFSDQAVRTRNKILAVAHHQSPKKLLKTITFIEAKLPKLIKKKHYYLAKRKTKLSHALEYDPKTKATYILLEGKRALLGEGRKKVVRKAIVYDRDRPKLVARAEQSLPINKELKMTKKLMGKKGVFEVLGCTRYKHRGKTHHAIYSSLYKNGTFRTLFTKKVRLSLSEKSKMAYNVLQGLDSLHKKGIVHRDLGARNYLVKISRGNPGRRDVVACIADLGRADYAKKLAKGEPAQGTPSYVAPEAVNPRRLKAKDYFATDVYAVGCVFYELFYEKTFPWHSQSFLRKESRKGQYLDCLEKATKKRRWVLYKQKRRSSSEDFEYLILRMLHSDPKKRPKAAYLVHKMGQICRKI